MTKKERFSAWLSGLADTVREKLNLLFRSSDLTLLATSSGPLSIDDLDPKDFAGFVLTAKERRLEELNRIESNSSGVVIRRNDRQSKSGAVEDADAAERKVSDSISNISGLGGGRVSVESEADMRITTLQEVLTYDSETSNIVDISESYIKRMKQSKVIETLADLSPEMSRALSDYLLMCNPGWTATAKSYKTDEKDDKAQPELDAIIDVLRDLYTSPDRVFNSLFQSSFLRGAIASEVVLDLSGREFVDLAVVDPESIIHKRKIDKVRGPIWTIWQRQKAGPDISLDIPQFSYIPINPFFNSNKGRPLVRPAIFVCFFLIATLQDLRRVIRQQGYPRIDITVDLEKIKRALPPGGKAVDIEKIKKFGNEMVQEVKDIYKKLKPDDVYIHSDVIAVNQPVGALNANSLGMIEGLLKAIERMATRALKTMPLLMATTDGVSEANANRQWEIYAQLIKSIQHFVEAVLEKHFTLALQARGVKAYCEFRFAELRASEALRDAQVEQMNTETARQQYDNGTISADEMAQKSTGDPTKTADEQEPRASRTPIGGDLGGIQAEPGSNRLVGLEVFIRRGLSDEWLMTRPERYTKAEITAVRSKILAQNTERVTAKEVADAAQIWKDHAPTKGKKVIEATERDIEQDDDEDA